MASAKWTLIGMYNYDNTIFNDMILPAGIDADLFKQSLLMEKGEFEVLYPNPDFMKHSIKLWSSKWFRTFSEWLKGTQAQWNPIYNYDRYEEGWDDHNRKYASVNNADYSDTRKTDMEELQVVNMHDKREADLKDKRTANLEDKRTADMSENRILNTKDSNEKNLKDESTFNNQDTTSQTKESTTEHQVAGYDSSSYQPSIKDIIDNGDSTVKHTGTVTNETTGTDTTAHSGTDDTTTKGTDKTEHTGTDTTAHTGPETSSHTGSDRNTTSGTDEMVHKGKLSDLSGTEKNTNQHTAHLYGNIGVTTSSAMLAEFYNIAKWNLYEHMADVFGSELLIQVY